MSLYVDIPHLWPKSLPKFVETPFGSLYPTNNPPRYENYTTYGYLQRRGAIFVDEKDVWLYTVT